jgi:general secretion pathway protein I
VSSTCLASALTVKREAKAKTPIWARGTCNAIRSFDSPHLAREPSKPVKPAHLVRQRAFSLIEVLVALTILAVGLIAASRAASVATFEQSTLRDRTLARWVAHNALAEVRLQATMATPGSSAREHLQSGIQFRATTTVSSTPSPLFSRVEVRVVRSDNPQYELAQAVGFSTRL